MPVTRRSSTAGTTAVQVKLKESFRVLKQGTPRGKVLLTSPTREPLPETESVSPRKRQSPKQEVSKVECSPPKKTRGKATEVSLSRSRSTRRVLGVAASVENLASSTENLTLVLPKAASTSKKSAKNTASKRKTKKTVTEKKEQDVHSKENVLVSPVEEDKQKTPVKSPKLNVESSRVLTLSPKPNATGPTNKARALDFNSPGKTHSTPVGQFNSPSKQQRLVLGAQRSEIRNLFTSPPHRDVIGAPTKHPSPMKPLISADSPVKRSIFGTPKKEGFLSPPPGGIGQLRSPFKTPTRPAPRSPLVSPRGRTMIGRSPCRAIFTSPPPGSQSDVRQSPRKNVNNPYCTAAMSPKRPVFASPENDVRQSPRKNFNNPFSSPSIRLAKQEGECYTQAKQALHTALPDRLLCREKEMTVVQSFVDNHVFKGAPGSMYVSGAPGTGKTAVLSYVMKQVQDSKKCPIVYVNCMACANSASIFNKVLSELRHKPSSLSAKEANTQLVKTLTSQGPNVVLILDEVDQLDSKNQEVLYTMFEWPALTNSRLILLGIANSLDLTDRILPRLQARPKCKPILLNFPPYTKDQLVTILKDRLSKVEHNGQPVMEPTAVQFCARKVAAVAGDMRKALDICRRAVEMVEAEVRKQQILKATTGCNSPYKESYKSPAKPKAPAIKKISVAHIAKIVGEVYGSRVSAANQKQGIPLQEKLALCTLLMMLKSGKGKEVQLGKLHEMYVKVCKQQQVSGHADLSEFMSMCMLSEAKGITSLKKAKDPRSIKVTLKLDEKELEHALQDKVLMSAVLKKGLPQK